MRIPPDPEGHGGSQRAWHLLRALSKIDVVDFVLLSRETDWDAQTTSLASSRSVARSTTHIKIAEWKPTSADQMWSAMINPGWRDLLRLGSHEAPNLSRNTLQEISEALPTRSADILFAGRLPVAHIANTLVEAKLLQARRMIVDFDDIMSRFRLREKAVLGRQGKILADLEIPRLKRVERQIARAWDAVSVCSEADVRFLKSAYGAPNALTLPNIVQRPPLSDLPERECVRLLFVGNLRFSPNLHGLEQFVRGPWRRLQGQSRRLELTVVGLNPHPSILKLAGEFNFNLAANVASVEPYYEDSDIVIAPISVGSGTRIKILEAMAYGRPVVATPVAAEGIDVTDDRDIVLMPSIDDFDKAILELTGDLKRRRRLAASARQLVEERYSFGMLQKSLTQMVRPQSCLEGSAMA